MTSGCGVPDQDVALDVGAATVISGRVLAGGTPVPSAYVRLLDSSGEFTAEVPTGAGGVFRFFVKPGDWTLRALSTAGQGERRVSAVQGRNEVELALG